MSMYSNIGGGRRQFASLYDNIGGSRKTISSAYGNINGSRKKIYPEVTYYWNVYTYNPGGLSFTATKVYSAVNDISYDVFLMNRTWYYCYNGDCTIYNNGTPDCYVHMHNFTEVHIGDMRDFGLTYGHCYVSPLLSSPGGNIYAKNYLSSAGQKVYFMMGIDYSSSGDNFYNTGGGYFTSTQTSAGWVYSHQVSSTNRNAYPDNGESGSYKYSYAGSNE